MKKLIFAGLLLGSSINLMADYVAGFISCENSNRNGKTYFIVKGQGNNLSSLSRRLAMVDFLNGEYAPETNDYCKSNKVWTNGTVFSYSSKSKANRRFSKLINQYKQVNYDKKIIIIKKGYDESDWR